MAEYSLEPVDVPPVSSRYRTICTKLPVPESLPLFETLAQGETPAAWGQPPLVWHRAEGFQVSDRWGNTWIDWSSCVVVTNAGHGHPAIKDALRAKIDQGLLASFMFVHESRARLIKVLQNLSPEPKGYRVFLLSTGSEAIENCIKLAKTYAIQKHGRAKNVIVSFNNSFHGRTMGAQLAGGMEGQKDWLSERDPCFVQVPFPDGYKNEDTRFDLFLETLDQAGIAPKNVAAVITETAQGVGPDFMPVEYAQNLERFCRTHDALLILDEVQAGFGRTGKMFAFEHLGITPDLIACGKGITSSLPLSAVIGRSDIMTLYAPGSMTVTHAASPLCVDAAIANIQVIQEERLVENSARLGEHLLGELRRIQAKYPEQLGCVNGQGLWAGIQIVRPGTKDPDPQTAFEINLRCFHKGLLMFAPVGIAGECIKIAPPLSITQDALDESIGVLAEVIDEIVAK